ncbi:550_t:CDS:2 [Gigaspora margarita]|uniref:550_t:CDS:1 n=1 Tax=Gigaspora margarita TaxID=4874 RepID=A0ABN7UQF7_GIGMA|nr:550_t:CDS:2 [Gigaspora margarita]
MSYALHEDVISYLQDCFKKPNNQAWLGPIVVSGQPYHHNPIGMGEKIAPDVAVRPRECFVQRANPPPDLPRGDFTGNSHARIVCQIANTQKINLWNTKCETWMHGEYVRCVFGLKIYPKKNIDRTVHQPIVARLWVRRELPGGLLSSNATLSGNGVYVKEWECGTIHHSTNTPTDCNAPNNDQFKVTIPVSDVFWDPPIADGVLNVDGYTPVLLEF